MSRQIPHLLRLIVMFAITLTGLAPFSNVHANQIEQQTPFNIVIGTWIGFAPFYIADELGFFKEEGVNARLLKIDDQGARRSAFNSGAAQAMADTLDSFANGVPSGLHGTVIFKIDDSYGGDGIVVRKTIRTIKDLRGKTVAYTQGLPPHFFLLYLLKQEGMTSKDITSLYMDAGDAGAAFVAGKVDAAVTWEPWLSKTRESGQGKVLVTSREHPGLIADIFIINNDIRESRKEDIEKVLKAWFSSLKYIVNKPDQARAIMAKHLGISAEEVPGMLEGIRLTTYQENLNYFGVGGKPNKFAEMFNAASEIWKQEGLITKTSEGKTVYDASYLADLYRN